jgi:nucleoside-diphosphate-sugar epimerase
LIIATDVIHAAHVNGAEELMFVGSSCIYPKLAPQPMREHSMLTGPLEPTNDPMRSPRSPASRRWKPIAASTAPTSSR